MVIGQSTTFDKHLHTRTTCRLCDSSDILLALAIQPSPIGNDYLPAGYLSVEQQLYPLDVYLCKQCGHAQNVDVIDRSKLFTTYSFKTTSSSVLINHFKSYAANVIEFAGCTKGSLVVEIGSNDGTLLSFFNDAGMKVLGVDPASNIAAEASSGSIETIPAFFTGKLAEEIVAQYGMASLICANNVYAHIDDMDDVTAGIKMLLDANGVFVFEVSYLVDMLQHMVFDTIYHEHLSYHTVEPLIRFFQKHGLKLIHVERVGTKGGSIRVFVTHAGSPREISAAVQSFVNEEQSLEISKLETFKTFQAKLDRIKCDLHLLLHKLKADGSTIAGFGASITVTTLIYQFELAPFIDFLVDDNPQKHGLFSPGHKIPVLHSDALYERQPDYTILLAWQYADQVQRKHQAYTDSGKRFIKPLPAVKLLP